MSVDKIPSDHHNDDWVKSALFSYTKELVHNPKNLLPMLVDIEIRNGTAFVKGISLTDDRSIV